jgi:putative ABC transport system permease protein
MFINYLKLSIRLLLRNPFFTTINILGLAVGFASFFGLWNYAINELKSDQYHVDHEKIVRVAIDWTWTDDNVNWGHMIIQDAPSPTIPRLRSDFAEVIDFVRINPVVAVLASPAQAKDIYREIKVIEADRNLFSFFSIPLIQGTPSDVLAEANSIVLSEKMALKYFGKKDPRNEMLIMNGTRILKVTGVFENLPHNTHLDFEFVLSNHSKLTAWNQDFTDWCLNYVKLSSLDFESFEEKVNSGIHTYWAELFEYFNSVKAKVELQPLENVAFERDHDQEQYRTKSRASLQTMAGVGVVILVMAWLNYINLAISRTARRMKEVATRKISGAGAMDFMWQFMTEASITNFIAAALAITFLQLFRQPADALLNVIISDWYSIDPSMAMFFLLVFVIGILFTGAYPALASRTAAPVELFQHARQAGKRFLLSLLTTLQYTLAIMLLFFALVMHHQLTFILNLNLGFDLKNVFFIEPAIIRSKTHELDMIRLKQKLSEHPEIRGTLQTSYFINLMMRRYANSEFIGLDGFITTEEHIPFFKNKLMAGRNFVPDDRNDVVIASQHATRRLGFNTFSDAVGQKIFVGDSARQFEIVGVIEDFRMASFLKMGNTESTTGRGQVLVYKKVDGMYPDALAVRVGDQSMASRAKVETIFRDIFPSLPFNGVFLDDWMETKYTSEKILRSQVTFFTMLAVGIACLGLLGMISNTIIDKTREIGIRKVLGAGSMNIVHVLVNASVLHVAIATVIALILGYFVSESYLERYLQRISITVFHFGIPVMILIVILGSTISVLVFRAITTNPVDALKHE